MILVATLLCDRKKHSQLWAVSRNAQLTYQDKALYINVETNDYCSNFGDLLLYIKDHEAVNAGIKLWLDIWHNHSTWMRQPEFDQDQARLIPIVSARNMAISCAMILGATHLLQVDSDVIIPPDSIEQLLSLNHPIVGGVVPGRGDHKHVNYISGNRIQIADNIIEADCGTCGFMLIQRSVFEYIRYRFGSSSIDKTVMLSEDPAYTEDAREIWKFGRMQIKTDLIAEHRDDPVNEFKPAQF